MWSGHYPHLRPFQNVIGIEQASRSQSKQSATGRSYIWRSFIWSFELHALITRSYNEIETVKQRSAIIIQIKLASNDIGRWRRRRWRHATLHYQRRWIFNLREQSQQCYLSPLKQGWNIFKTFPDSLFENWSFWWYLTQLIWQSQSNFAFGTRLLHQISWTVSTNSFCETNCPLKSVLDVC